jgi:hypothetical protein
MGLVAVSVIAALTLTGCSSIAEPNKVGLYYAQGSIDGNHFDHCIDPGTAGSYPINDEVIWINADLRTWNIAASGGDTNTPITVTSKPDPTNGQPSGVQVNVWTTTNFHLNTSCKGGKDSPLARWWNDIGRRYEADTDKGWIAMLQNTLVPALERADKSVIRNYSDADLVSGVVFDRVQQEISTVFQTELKRVVGGEYFCGPTFDRAKNPDVCPAVEVLVKDIDYTDPAIQDARNKKKVAVENAAAQVAAAKGKADAAVAEAQGQVDAANKVRGLYGNAAWLKLQVMELNLQIAEACGKNPNCHMIMGTNGQIITTQ